MRQSKISGHNNKYVHPSRSDSREASHRQPPAGIYPGWWVVFATASGQLIQGGFVFWSMGLYTATFEDVFGAPRAQINLIETCLTVATNLLSPLAGILIDRWSIRHLMMIGMTAMGLGLMILSQAGTLLHIWVVWASLIPLGVLLIGAIPSAALISRWFIRRRGLALGLAATGSSLGGFLMPPFMTWMFWSGTGAPDCLSRGACALPSCRFFTGWSATNPLTSV